MKKEFTLTDILARRGCYERKEVYSLFENRSYSLIEIIKRSNIPLEDRVWFLFNSCEMSTGEAVELSLQMAEAVVLIYNERYPNDDRVSECIEGVRAFRAGKIGEEELRRLRASAAAAYDYDYDSAAYAADSAASYAAAAAYDYDYDSAAAYAAAAASAYYAAYAAHAAYSASAAAAAAAYAARAANLTEIIINFVENN